MPDFGQGQANSAEILTNKTIDATLQTKTDNFILPPNTGVDDGVFQNVNATRANYGMLANPVELGTWSNGGLDLQNGWAATYTSSASANVQAGVRWQGMTCANFNPYYRMKMFTDSVSANRMYMGWIASDTPINSDTPYSSGTAGLMMGWRSTDTNWQVFSNDASGTGTVTNTGVAKGVAVTTIEIAFSSSGVVCKLNDSVVATLTTDIPTTTTILALHQYIVTTTTAAKLVLFYKGYVRHKRTNTPF